MLDIETRIKTLKRPKMLARAARFGVDEYRRDVHLPRLISFDRMPRNGEALVVLMDLEEEMNRQRVSRSGDYRLALHVAVLIAIAGEARLLRASAKSYGTTYV